MNYPNKERRTSHRQGAGLIEATLAVRLYLAERFPISSQGTAVLAAFFCSYMVYGQIQGKEVFDWATAAGGISVVLLALLRRIADDIEDLPDEIRSGRVVATDGGWRHLRGLIVGGVATTTLLGLLNAMCSGVLLLVALGAVAWLVTAMVVKHTLLRSVGILFFSVNESWALVTLLYSYAVWCEVAGATVPPLSVAATIGLFWTTFQFWNFTRRVGGPEGWPLWGLSMDETRVTLLAFLAFAALCSISIAHYARLGLDYLLYGPTLSIVFAAIILRWWSHLPAQQPDRVSARWGGLPFAIAVEAGLMTAVLVAAI